MKHLILALVIALLSTPAATTAWSQQTEQAGPTEQETKGFIVDTMSKCGPVNEVKFEGSNLHLSTYAEGLMIGTHTGRSMDITVSFNGIVPVQNLKGVYTIVYNSEGEITSVPNTRLGFHCKATESGCLGNNRNEFIACSGETNRVLKKAFNHLIGIYDAERPKPLFE